MELDLFITIKEWSTQANGKMIKCMEKGNKDGLMELFLLEFFKKGLKFKDSFIGLMEILIRDPFSIINFLVLELLLGVMEGILKGNGKIIPCMDKESLFGQMDRSLLVFMRMMRSKVKVSLVFLKVLLLKEIG